MLEKAAEAKDGNVYEELRERKARKLNVVVYGKREADKEATEKEGSDWDMTSCENLYNALQLGITTENNKFCRRVGERGQAARPLMVDFYKEKDRARLLRCNTRKTVFADVEMCLNLPELEKGGDSQERGGGKEK
jgi:hypothetical protein